MVVSNGGGGSGDSDVIFVIGGRANTDIEQLLDEFEHDIINDQNRGLCYRLRQIIQTRSFDNS